MRRTDDCPICFGPKALLPLSPLFLSATWSFSVGITDVFLTFDQTMDEATSPGAASFELVVNGTIRTLAPVVWVSGNRLRLQTLAGAGPSTSLTVELITVDDRLKGVNGAVVNLFGPEDIL